MNIVENEKIWVEKYRPQFMDDIILPQKYKDKFSNMLNNSLPNILLTSTPGVGKGSIISTIINSGKYEVMFVNASRENSINDIRGKVYEFVSTLSVLDLRKIVVFDEADRLNSNAQDSLKADIEQFSDNVSFIFTSNHPEKIIPALTNRLQLYDLDIIFNEHKKELMEQTYKRIKAILNNEQIKHTQNDILVLIKYFYPSIRKILIIAQQSVENNELKLQMNKNNVLPIIDSINKKKFTEVFKLLDNFSSYDYFVDFFYKNIDKLVKSSEDYMNVVIELAKYQNYMNLAKNKKIPLLAFISYLIRENIKLNSSI